MGWGKPDVEIKYTFKNVKIPYNLLDNYMIYWVLVKENLMFNAIGICANLIKNLRIIKPEFEVIFPSRLLSVLKETIHHKDKEMFSEDLI